jgi:type IV secretory pathway VirD2 relaxase
MNRNQQSLRREVEQGQRRWTSPDRALQREVGGGTIRLERLNQDTRRTQLVGRLQHLQRMGLAESRAPGAWTLRLPQNNGIILGKDSCKACSPDTAC